MTRAAEDAWSILGVPPGAPLDMVRAQYLRMVRINHPDQYTANPKERARHEEIMKRVTWAYREITQGRAEVPRKASTPPPRRSQSRPYRPVDLRELMCRAHQRWAVSYCTVCAAPLCSRCDESLSGYCTVHRPRGRF